MTNENTPKMTIEIFRNNKKVNEIVSTDEKNIYKEIASAFVTKLEKRGQVKLNYSGWQFISMTIKFNEYQTQLENTCYTYKYTFENVKL